MNYQAKADRIFSTYIRLRDADDNGYIKCISCGKIVQWKQSDCGHYVNRRHLSLRYDEKNCNAQCRECNRFDEGCMIGYHAGLIEKYGLKVIKYLEIKKHNTCKLTNVEYTTIINFYKNKIKNFKNIKI